MVLVSKGSTELEKGPSCHLGADPGTCLTGLRMIFRATGDSIHGRDSGDVIRNILNWSNRKAPVADFQERKNMMDATGLTVTRRLSTVRLRNSHERQRTLCRIYWSLVVTLPEALAFGVLLQRFLLT